MVGKRRCLGIRLIDGRVAYAELERLFGRVRVVDSGSIDLDGGEKDDRSQSGARRFRRGKPGGISSRRSPSEQVVVGLPRRQLVCRFIDLPNVDDERLGGLLAYEIERHLPFPVEEAYYGFQKISASGSTARVLIVAAKRTDVQQAVEQVERLGIKPTGVDVSSVASSTALLSRRQYRSEKILTFIQLEGSDATVDVMLDGALMSSRTVSLAGESMAIALEPIGSSAKAGDPSATLLLENRVPVEGYLSFSNDRMLGEGTVTDLSRNGMRVNSKQSVEPGTSFKLSVALPGLRDSLEVALARVQWVAGGSFGCEIIIADTDARAQIQQYLARSAGYSLAQAPAPVVSVVEHADHTLEMVSHNTEGRFRAEGAVTFSGEGIEGKGTVANLSKHGWRIISDEPVTAGMVLRLDASLSEMKESVEIRGARVQWTRPGEFGLQTILDDEEVSRRIARYVGSDRSVQVPTRFRPENTMALFNELRRIAQASGGSPGKVLVHGEGAEDLCRVLRDDLGLHAKVWNASLLSADPGAFGLALRGLENNAHPLDLLPVERKVVPRDGTHPVFYGLLALVAVLAAAWWGSDALMERRILQQLEDQSAAVKIEAEAVDSLERDYAALKNRAQALEGLASTQGRAMNLLKEVVMLLPPDVLLQEFTLDGDKVRLRGSTSSSAATLISAFEHSTMLENAAFTAPISVQGKDRQAFEIAATLRQTFTSGRTEKAEKGAM